MPIGIGIGLSPVLGGAVGAVLSFTGSTTIAEDFNGVAFTLVVSNNPASDPYNIFAEETDADGIATISGDEVTIAGTLDYETATSHTLVYSANSAGGRPELTLTINVTVTDVSEGREFMAYPGVYINSGSSRQFFAYPGIYVNEG